MTDIDTFRIQIADHEKERDRIELRIEQMRAELNRRLAAIERREMRNIIVNSWWKRVRNIYK